MTEVECILRAHLLQSKAPLNRQQRACSVNRLPAAPLNTDRGWDESGEGASGLLDSCRDDQWFLSLEHSQVRSPQQPWELGGENRTFSCHPQPEQRGHSKLCQLQSLARWAHTAPGVPQAQRGCTEPIPVPHRSYVLAAANTGSSSGHGKGAMQSIIETQNVLGWKGCERSSHSNLPSWAETPKLHPWPGSQHPTPIKHSKCRLQSAAFGDPTAAHAVTGTMGFPH